MQQSKPTFDEPWDSSGASGGKRFSIGQHNKKPDHFVGFGKDRGCIVSASWHQIMRFAASVLSSDNTLRVVESTDVPSWAYIEERPTIFKSRDTEYRYTTCSYVIGNSDGQDGLPQGHLNEGPFDLVEVGGNEATLQRNAPPKGNSIKPDRSRRYDDRWVKNLGLSSGSRFSGSWWDMMCFSVDVLSSKPTRTVMDCLPDEISLPERVWYGDRDTSAFEFGEPPYQFEEESIAVSQRNAGSYPY